jgi:endogenous inhibitor of DNA gyrase (YacG/DUF329 family)
MQPHVLARKPLGEAMVDVCAGCQALWFDAFESVQLTPGATLALFDAIGKAAPRARRALPTRLPCPRCVEPLMLTHDLQRTTRFSYYRCRYGHGRFTPFFQFLREKEFIRPLGPEELARLKAAVRIIRCSSCGAPVDLERETACPYCRAPITILDPDAVAATTRALTEAENRRTAIDIGALVDGLLDNTRRAGERDGPGRAVLDDDPRLVDLVDLGLAALSRLRVR